MVHGPKNRATRGRRKRKEKGMVQGDYRKLGSAKKARMRPMTRMTSAARPLKTTPGNLRAV